VGLNVLAFGSYNSAEARDVEPSVPPATRTRPSESSVAVASWRAAVIEPVVVNAPALGSYSSAVARYFRPPLTSCPPPSKRTRPSGSSVAVSPARAVTIEPVALNPGAGVGEAVAVGVGVGVRVGLGLADGIGVATTVGDAMAELPEQPTSARETSMHDIRRPTAREIGQRPSRTEPTPSWFELGTDRERIAM
jgi:hypothetical protein